MRVHFLGIAGTFMASLSLLAKELGMQVSGQDQQIYPPMSTMLAENNIDVEAGFEVSAAVKAADIVVVGNVMRRGMLVVEYLLDNRLALVSGPEFLAKHVLAKIRKQVLVVAGTHGKTTTTSMLTWILTAAGLKPGYLIGGIAKNFPTAASLGGGDYFVLEGDEYDSAFFDKRSKFIHYRPDILIINNLEFDHADIFQNLAAIQTQFHHLIRTMPRSGCIIVPQTDQNVAAVLDQGCWSTVIKVDLAMNINNADWPFWGNHNLANAYAAITAAKQVGITIEQAASALNTFAGSKRRLELLGNVSGVAVYDDFAHHPTAINATIAALRGHLEHRKPIDRMASSHSFDYNNNNKDQNGKPRIIALVDICSNTMRAGTHRQQLIQAVAGADQVYFFHDKPLAWDINATAAHLPNYCGTYQQVAELVQHCVQVARSGDQILVMSNGAFAGIHVKLLAALQQQFAGSAEATVASG